MLTARAVLLILPLTVALQLPPSTTPTARKNPPRRRALEKQSAAAAALVAGLAAPSRPALARAKPPAGVRCTDIEACRGGRRNVAVTSSGEDGQSSCDASSRQACREEGDRRDAAKEAARSPVISLGRGVRYRETVQGADDDAAAPLAAGDSADIAFAVSEG